MIKKLLCATALMIASTTSSFALMPFELPQEFTVTERFFSLTSTYDIESPRFKMGYVDRKFFSLKLEYDFYDYTDQLQAKARMRWLSFGAIFDVTDEFDQPIGLVEEEIFNFFPTFNIYSPRGERLATAQMNFWGTEYLLTDPFTNRPIASISRPFFRFFIDSWTVTIVDPMLFAEKNINPALFITLAAFQTDSEYWRAQQSQNNNTQYLFNAQIEKDDPVATLREQINTFTTDFEGIEPIEADFKAADRMAQRFITRTGDSKLSEKEQAVESLNEMISLHDTDELSVGEKSALFHLMDAKLKQYE